MLGLTTTRRLRAAQHDAQAARERAETVQGELERATGRYTDSVAELTVLREAAEDRADREYWHAEAIQTDTDAELTVLRAERDRLAGELADAHAWAGLARQAVAVAGPWVLLHYGRVHSLHSSGEAAYAVAEECGAVPGGWSTTRRPAWREMAETLIPWRVVHLGGGGRDG